MSLRIVLQRILFTILLPLSISSAICLYFYPVLQGCAFPLPKTASESVYGSPSPLSSSWLKNGVINTLFQHATDWRLVAQQLPQAHQPEPAIFRLLVLADPQIEGDSSLPSPDDEFGSRLRRHWMTIRSGRAPTVDNDNDTNALGKEEEAEESIPLNASLLKDVVQTVLFEDIPSAFQAARKRLDLLGNDYYLAHIYRTLSWWSRPTHVTVLGDLIGSQWVTDGEFENRGWRYWHRVFRGGARVGDDTTITGSKAPRDGDDVAGSEEEKLEVLQRYNSSWANKIINIAGNHDIGYAGDVSRRRLERFERAFGRADWDIRFAHPPVAGEEQNEDHVNNGSFATIRPTLHIINLNDLTLDGPAFDDTIQADSYNYINDLLTHRSYPVEDQTSFTLLLTHVPLHKRDGICVDGPYFTFFDEDDIDGSPDDNTARFRQNGLREQNHLSEHVSSNGILQGIFGMSGDPLAPAQGKGRRGLILTGHDHQGCDVIHFVNRTVTSPIEPDDNDNQEKASSSSWHWDATRYHPSTTSSSFKSDSLLSPLADDSDTPSIREVTLRSMMGEFGGNAALLSVWFDADPAVNEWRYEIQMCPAGVQHIWWAVHGLALGCLIGFILIMLLRTLELVRPEKEKSREDRKNGVSETWLR